MKRLFIFLFTAICFAAEASPSDLFTKAQKAYDNEQYAEAATLYESMLDSGINNTEIYYNLANAYFKSDDLPRAIKFYRTAWFHSPRDPDIQANLQFAFDTAGVVAPQPPWVERSFRFLSKHEWQRVAAGAYCLLALLLILALLLRRQRRLWLTLCTLPGMALVLATAGWWNWNSLERHPEYVVATNTTALHSPLDNARSFFNIPEGALVKQEEIQGEWIKISYNGKNGGWLKEEDILHLSP